MKIVTAGSRYVDIDAYACMIAKSELCNLLGEETIPVSTTVLNESITPTILSWGSPLQTSYQPAGDDIFGIVDITDPDFLDGTVDISRVVEIVDHHSGYEKDWQDRIGAKAHIEPVGAASTLVFEQWQSSSRVAEMSELSARLLLTGILDNTLNFGASLTTERDHQAYKTLLSMVHLPTNWPEQYFGECQQLIEADLPAAILHDAQSNFAKLPETAAQLLVWDASTLLNKRHAELTKALNAMSETWFVNLISLKEGQSYILVSDQSNQAQLAKLMGLTFQNGTAPAGRLWLRKEIVKAAQLQYG